MMIMTQKSEVGGSKVRLETYGRTDTTDFIAFLANAVGNNKVAMVMIATGRISAKHGSFKRVFARWCQCGLPFNTWFLGHTRICSPQNISMCSTVLYRL